MALLFIDSFDHYSTATLNRKWNERTSGVSINTTNGRRSSQSMRSDGSSTQRALKTLGTNAATVICGFAIKVTTGTTTPGYLCGFADGGTEQMNIYINADLTISVRRGTTNVATSSATLSVAGGYQYLEAKFVHSNTGSYEIRLNGVNILSASGVDTTGSTNNYATHFSMFNRYSGSIGGFQASTAIDIDDLYICDGTGGVNDDFLGDVRVDAYLPNANGNSSQLSGSDGNNTDNYLLVDESTPNDDTDYVQSATPGEKDTYSFGNMLHTPATINGLQVCMYARKDDGGLRTACSVTRSGGADTDGTAIALSTGYLFLTQISQTDPDTSAAWTQSGFDAAEFGIKVVA